MNEFQVAEAKPIFCKYSESLPNRQVFCTFLQGNIPKAGFNSFFLKKTFCSTHFFLHLEVLR